MLSPCFRTRRDTAVPVAIVFARESRQCVEDLISCRILLLVTWGGRADVRGGNAETRESCPLRSLAERAEGPKVIPSSRSIETAISGFVSQRIFFWTAAWGYSMRFSMVLRASARPIVLRSFLYKVGERADAFLAGQSLVQRGGKCR